MMFQLAHPILESLEGTSDAWACELVRAVAAGDVAAFERVKAQTHHPDLVRADRQLRQKIAILCLMEVSVNMNFFAFRIDTCFPCSPQDSSYLPF